MYFGKMQHQPGTPNLGQKRRIGHPRSNNCCHCGVLRALTRACEPGMRSEIAE